MLFDIFLFLSGLFKASLPLVLNFMLNVVAWWGYQGPVVFDTSNSVNVFYDEYIKKEWSDFGWHVTQSGYILGEVLGSGSTTVLGLNWEPGT